MKVKLSNGKEVEAAPADGVRGFLIRVYDRGNDLNIGHPFYIFRVYGPNHDNDHTDFIDYELRHNDLEVTLHNGTFYKFDADHTFLDHNPKTLGLEQVDE